MPSAHSATTGLVGSIASSVTLDRPRVYSCRSSPLLKRQNKRVGGHEGDGQRREAEVNERRALGARERCRMSERRGTGDEKQKCRTP